MNIKAYEHNEMILTIRNLERRIRKMVYFVDMARHRGMCRGCSCHKCHNCMADNVWKDEQLDQYDDYK